MGSKLKSISKDFFYNITASVVLTGVMQIVVYPALASVLSNIEYGVLLTVMGITNTIIVALGNTLNNVRLIMASDYESHSYNGDFQVLIVISAGIGIIASFIISKFYFHQSLLHVFFIMVTIAAGIFKSYYCVEFRLHLNFKKILVQNIIGSIGYIIGILIINKSMVWPVPFACAEIAQLIYVIKSTSLVKEPYRVTPLFKNTISKYLILIITGMSTTLITYLDRLIIFPLLGGEAVSLYTVASIFGKSLGIVMTPIAGVLLGYYAQKNFSMTTKRFWLINIVALVAGGIFIVVSIIISPPITRLLYPSLFSAARSFIFVANVGATFNVVCSLTQASILKFAPTWLQFVKELVYCATYVGFGIVLLKQYALFGFCIAAILANIAKLVSLYIIGSLFIGKRENAEQN